MKLLIIGNGIAGLSAAEHFRKFDNHSEVVMLSEDRYPTYYRLKLSHYLAKPEFDVEELIVKQPSWYDERKIEVATETRVEKVDFENKRVVTASGETHTYDRLLIACGAHPFVPPIKGADSKGVFSLRSLDDLIEMHEDFRDKDHITVIGGGLLGLEAAYSLRTLGKQVTVVEFFPYLLPRQLDEGLSQGVKAQLEDEGLSFRLGAACDRIDAEQGKVNAIELNTGERLETDAVVISAGIRPNLSLFEGTDLKVDKGVVVDERMRTNLPDVYAAGDVAAYKGMVYGLWTASNEQGKVAGMNLAGRDSTYAEPRLVATLNIGGVKLFSCGDVSEPDRILVYEEGEASHRLYVKGNRIVGAALTGDLAWMLKVRKLVDEKHAIDTLPDPTEEKTFFLGLVE